MAFEVSNVTVNFGGNTVLDDVGLDAQHGSITALIGPNGAGKTTLFNVITGVLKVGSGRIHLDSADLTGLPPHRRTRAGVGRTFQRLELFGTLSVLENLRVAASALPRSGRRSAVDTTIDRLGLGPMLDMRCDTLSTGAGRVVELGRTLVGRPKVLLLDEPASGQNEQETARFSEILLRLAGEGTAILLVEHDMDLVMSIAERIHVLDFGRLIASGTPEAIRNDPGVQAAYLGEVVPVGPAP